MLLVSPPLCKAKNIKTGDIVVDGETYKIVNNNIYARIINESKDLI